jgi:hypothetical protein
MQTNYFVTLTRCLYSSLLATLVIIKIMNEHTYSKFKYISMTVITDFRWFAHVKEPNWAQCYQTSKLRGNNVPHSTVSVICVRNKVPRWHTHSAHSSQVLQVVLFLVIWVRLLLLVMLQVITGYNILNWVRGNLWLAITSIDVKWFMDECGIEWVCIS